LKTVAVEDPKEKPKGKLEKACHVALAFMDLID
jgi:hypothetical protein